MRFGPVGIWEIIVIVGVALLIFGPVTLPKIARGVGNAVRTAREVKDEVTGVVLDDERPVRKTRAVPAPPAPLPAAAEDAPDPSGAGEAPGSATTRTGTGSP